MTDTFILAVEILLAFFAAYLFFFYFDIFFARKSSRFHIAVGFLIFEMWQFAMLAFHAVPVYVNITVTVVITFLSAIAVYRGMWWKQCVFAIAFNAIWMFMETLCNYILLIYGEKYAEIRPLGSLISKLFLLVVIIALKKVFTNEELKDLPVKYTMMLVFIPTGSIYIMYNVFMLGFIANSNRVLFNSVVTVIILLGINVLIFYIYMKLADDLQLRRMTSVYEQQLELCERHQQEREISTLQLRDIKHNMKNNLVTILAYAENQETEKIVGFVRELMEDGGINVAHISNSGNIVIDSLMGYWYTVAQKKGIDFSVDVCVPMIMPFKGADICLILGNLLENAVEASEKSEEERYIHIQIRYDKGNLLIFVTNSYRGKLLKTKSKQLKTTKSDAGNHGVGLPSVYRAAAKYQGTVDIEDSLSGHFKIRMVLYGNQKLLHEQPELLHESE